MEKNTTKLVRKRRAGACQLVDRSERREASRKLGESAIGLDEFSTRKKEMIEAGRATDRHADDKQTTSRGQLLSDL